MGVIIIFFRNTGIGDAERVLIVKNWLGRAGLHTNTNTGGAGTV